MRGYIRIASNPPRGEKPDPLDIPLALVFVLVLRQSQQQKRRLAANGPSRPKASARRRGPRRRGKRKSRRGRGRRRGQEYRRGCGASTQVTKALLLVVHPLVACSFFGSASTVSKVCGSRPQA